jgi:hypothetical protein
MLEIEARRCLLCSPDLPLALPPLFPLALPPRVTSLPPLALPFESLDTERDIDIDFRLSFEEVRYIAGANGEMRSPFMLANQTPPTCY